MDVSDAFNSVPSGCSGTIRDGRGLDVWVFKGGDTTLEVIHPFLEPCADAGRSVIVYTHSGTSLPVI